jgi:hypothetical protein
MLYQVKTNNVFLCKQSVNKYSSIQVNETNII